MPLVIDCVEAQRSGFRSLALIILLEVRHSELGSYKSLGRGLESRDGGGGVAPLLGVKVHVGDVALLVYTP